MADSFPVIKKEIRGISLYNCPYAQLYKLILFDIIYMFIWGSNNEQ